VITVGTESLLNCLKELAPHLAEHWDEVETFIDKQHSPLDPDFVTYLSLESTGQLALVVARDGSTIAGYMWDIVAQNPHYKQVYSVNDMLYVNKDYRGRGILGTMCDVMENHVITMGAVVRSMNVKATNPAPDMCGYSQKEVVYFKNLIEV